MPIVRRKKVLFIPPPSMASGSGSSSSPGLPGTTAGQSGSPSGARASEGTSGEQKEAKDADGGEEKKNIMALSPSQPVWFMPETGEIFTTYEAYCARRAFYLQPIFQCEVTGKSGLRFFDALKSERTEARTLEARFPEQLKAPVLKSVQFQVVGRLDDLVTAVYERFKDRFFQGERVLVEQGGDRFVASVRQVYPPRKRSPSSSSNSHIAPAMHPLPSILGAPTLDDPAAYFYSVQILTTASASGLEKEGKEGTPAERKDKKRKLAEDVNGTESQSRRRSLRKKNGEEHESKKDAETEKEAKDPAADPAGGIKAEEPAVGEGFKGSLMEVTPSQLSRDRLTFSKSILRRYLAATVERGAAVASPWVVKRSLCKRYGIEETMPEVRKEEVEEIRRGALGKRKKAITEKVEEREREREREAAEARLKEEAEGEDDGRPKKRRKSGKKSDEKSEKKAAAEAEKRRKEEEERKRKEEEAAAAAKKAAEEAAAAAAALAAKKKPVKYPTEDLDVRLSEREKKNGKRVRRPVWKKDVFFLELGQDMWETFLETWNFLSIFSKPLLLAPFTMDDYAAALRHMLLDPACVLIGEVHMALMTLIARDVPGKRHTALLSLGNDLSDKLTDRLTEVGEGWEQGGWEKKSRGMGWEEALIGCLKEHATRVALPRLQQILEHLLVEEGAIREEVPAVTAVPALTAGPSAPASSSGEPPSSPITEISIDGDGDSQATSTPLPVTPKTRYLSLPVQDKLALVKFLSELAVVSKTIKSWLEAGDAQLTELRKEKIELNRERKRVAEEIAAVEERLNPPKTEEEKKEEEEREAAAAAEAEDKDAKAAKGKKPNGKASKAGSAETPQGSDEAEDIDMEGSPAKSKKTNGKTKLDVVADAETPMESDFEMDAETPDIDPSSDIDSDSGNILRPITHTSRQKSLLQKHLQREAEEAIAAERRSAAKVASAALRALHVEKRKLEEEDIRYSKRLEGIEREFRKLLAAQRQKPLGKDRFHNLIWWFDGMGGQNLTGAGGNYLWQTARLFVQGASEADRRAWEGAEGFEERAKEEECETGLLEPGEWAYYDTVEEVEEFMGWLSVKGRREFNLDRMFQTWGEYIVGGMRRRANEIAQNAGRAPDTRRSSRVKTGFAEVLREPYMQYTNRKSAHK